MGHVDLAALGTWALIMAVLVGAIAFCLCLIAREIRQRARERRAWRVQARQARALRDEMREMLP